MDLLILFCVLIGLLWRSAAIASSCAAAADTALMCNRMPSVELVCAMSEAFTSKSCVSGASLAGRAALQKGFIAGSVSLSNTI